MVVNVIMLNELKYRGFWMNFLAYKMSNEHLSSFEEKDLRDFVEKSEYLNIVSDIENGGKFPLPNVRELNKKQSSKKRTVFVFERNENYVLKAIAYLLNRYDYVFCGNLYSFRENIGVKNAIKDLTGNPRMTCLYSYKADIHDYFNSVDTGIILEHLRKTIIDDSKLYNFIVSLLTERYAYCDGEKVSRKKGIMAGVPVSGFLANLYLKDLDAWFAERKVIYARYSDDIIVFAETAELITEYEQKIKEFLSERKLTINQKKELRTVPGEPWEFLGFCVDEEEIDLSDISLGKMKDKMRRKAKALVRWKKRTGACNERAISAFIKHFNRKFYDNPKQHEITWCRWYFPTITTSKSLHILDEYMISCIRYIATGKHTKANFNLRYDDIKKLGYRSLVNAFYKYKKTNII